MSLIREIHEKMAELLNIVEINKDTGNEISIDRLELRQKAIDDMKEIVAELTNAKKILTDAITINNVNNQKALSLLADKSPDRSNKWRNNSSNLNSNHGNSSTHNINSNYNTSNLNHSNSSNLNQNYNSSTHNINSNYNTLNSNHSNSSNLNHDNLSIDSNIFSPPDIIYEEINGLYLSARRINYIEEAGPDLCFMPAINRFIVRIAGNTLIGNIGNIYDMCPNPERVKECKYIKSKKYAKCMDDCRFYHNPLVFASSKEPRNYFSTCIQYISSDNIHQENHCRYGSRQFLKRDLERISSEEARRFEDFLAHLFLCWLILRKYKPMYFET